MICSCLRLLHLARRDRPTISEVQPPRRRARPGRYPDQLHLLLGHALDLLDAEKQQDVVQDIIFIFLVNENM